MCQYFCLFSVYKWGKDTFKCVNDTLLERVQGTIVCVRDTAVCVQGTAIYVSRAQSHNASCECERDTF